MSAGSDFRPVVFDTGVLIALEGADRRLAVLLARARELQQPILIPAGVLAQAWRDGARQVRLARLIRASHVRIVDLTAVQARAAGELCGRRDTSDVIDASVVIVARSAQAFVATSDPDDLKHLDPELTLARV